MEDYYFDFQVTPYALPQVCEALHWNGVKDACITSEDGEIHIRWKRDINRYRQVKFTGEIGECNG